MPAVGVCLNHCAKLSPAEMLAGSHSFQGIYTSTWNFKDEYTDILMLSLIYFCPLTFACIFVSCHIPILNEIAEETKK